MNKRFVLAMVIALFTLSSAVFASNRKAGHVILIGLDGWGSYSVEKADMPHVKKLMQESIMMLCLY